MQWLQCPKYFDEQVSLGINVFLGRGCDEQSAQQEVRDLAARGGYSVQPYDPAIASSPALFGWRFEDEPDQNGIAPEQIDVEYLRNRQRDPGHVNFLTLTNGFVDGGADRYRRYTSSTDLVGFDLYPVTGWCRPDWLPRVGSEQAALRALAGGRPTFQWIEAISTASKWCTGRGVTAAELRAEVWLAIASGARAIGYFTHSWKPTYSQFRVAHDVKAEMKRTNEAITTLAPAILGAPTRFGTWPPLVGTARRFHGALYLIAVNPTRAPATTSLSLPGARSVLVFGEGRSLAAPGGRFADSFGPLAVHVYISRP